MDLNLQSANHALPWRVSGQVEQQVGPSVEWPGNDASRQDGDTEPNTAAQAATHDAGPKEPRMRGQVVPRANADELAALIARVMQQDEAALSELYAVMSGQVYAVALRFTRRVDAAEEVLQDTFWQIWRQAPRFDPARGTAVGWIMTIARSRALDTVRSVERDPVRTLRAISVDGIDIIGESAADPLDLLRDVRRDSLLHNALSALDPLRRQLIGLAFYRGLTHEEIASQTGLPLGTVKSHLRRALAALRQALGADLGVEDLGSAA